VDVECDVTTSDAPVTNWELPGVTLAGYWYAKRRGMKVQIVTSYRVSHFATMRRYGTRERYKWVPTLRRIRGDTCHKIISLSTLLPFVLH
jgi:hypothetical protein